MKNQLILNFICKVSSPAESDLISESSQSQSSSASSKTCDSSGTSNSNSSLSSLGSSGTSSRVSARTKREQSKGRLFWLNFTNNWLNGDLGPRSRSSRSDISAIENQKIPLQPNDLVWAKCSGYPWYPALVCIQVSIDFPNDCYVFNRQIVNPDTDFSTDSKGIPVPPEDVLSLRKKEEKHNPYLVSFFDTKRTWYLSLINCYR